MSNQSAYPLGSLAYNKEIESNRAMALAPPPPAPTLSGCLFFFGVFLSMLARAAGP